MTKPEVKKVNSHKPRHFKTWETNLDYSYFKKPDMDIAQYKKFLFVLHIKLLLLSHGHAAVERGFSLGKSSLQLNIKEESIVAKKTVRDHLLSNKIDMPSFEIPSKLIIACNTVHSKYKASLEKTTKDSIKVLEKERTEVFEEELKELGEKEKIDKNVRIIRRRPH